MSKEVMVMQESLHGTFSVRLITILIIKITISSIMIGLKTPIFHQFTCQEFVKLLSDSSISQSLLKL